MDLYLHCCRIERYNTIPLLRGVMYRTSTDDADGLYPPPLHTRQPSHVDREDGAARRGSILLPDSYRFLAA